MTPIINIRETFTIIGCTPAREQKIIRDELKWCWLYKAWCPSYNRYMIYSGITFLPMEFRKPIKIRGTVTKVNEGYFKISRPRIVK